MRDEERIQDYYRFGTIDNFSELSQEGKSEKKTRSYKVLRLLKFATLIWLEVLKNLSPVKK